MPLPIAREQRAADPVMHPGAAWSEPEHFPVFLNRLIIGALALLSLARCQMPPQGMGGYFGKLPHGEEREIAVDLTGLVQNLGILGVEPVEFQGDVNGILVAFQTCVATQ